MSSCDPRALPCLDRRAFLANTGLLAVAAALTASCGDGDIGNTVAGPIATGTDLVVVKTGDYASLGAVGGIALLNGTQRPVAVVRDGQASYRAFSLICPHQGTTVNVLNGTSFRCPNHGATFAATGRWTGGEPTGNLTEYAVTLDAAAGTLSIRY